MGFLDFWKRKNKTQGLQYAPTMNGNLPFYSSFGDSIYASDLVVQSIRCKANEFKKLNPRHIRYVNGIAENVFDSTIARALRRPTEWMTTADFLEKITILLELNKNVFIYPMYYVTNANERFYTGLYPLKPSEVQYKTDEGGRMYVDMQFSNGYQTTVPADSLIHWRKDYGVNDYFGGGMFGGNDDAGLLTMLKRYDQLTQGIAKALEVSCKINGIVKYNTYHADETMSEKMVEFEKRLQANESGILATDLSTEYQHIPRDVKVVDKETLDFFYMTILRANGTSLPILNGDYTKAQKEAYYEHALEADIKSLGQAFDRAVFTEREISYGNQIAFYPNEINFMSMENKIEALKVGLPAGIFMKDEARELLGYPPLPDGAGQVVPQGYNALLDSNNKNKIAQGDNGENEQE
jgi:HK97 family phage portal protein